MKTELTFEESQKLIELGISKEYTTPIRTIERRYWGFRFTDLLYILPKEPLADYCLQITNWRNDIWYVGYTMQDEDPLIMYNCGELIDGLYKLVIWCIEHGYIETE